MGWRDIAMATPFEPDKILQFSRDELETAYVEISKIAPIGLYGDGIDTFWDDLNPWDAKTNWEYRVSEIFSIVRNKLNILNVGDIHQERVIELAQAHFESVGIVGNALDNYFYPDADGEFFDGWAWLDADIARAIQKKTWLLEESLDFDKIIAWVTRYPWRKCHPLRYMVRFSRVRKNTIDWHAANILYHAECIENIPIRKDEISTYDEETIQFLLKEKLRHALEMGASCKSIILKQGHEVHALRGKKVVDSARAGGAARGGSLRARVDVVLVEMKRHIDNGHSVSNAARLAHSKGVGLTPEANRKAWNRRDKR